MKENVLPRMRVWMVSLETTGRYHRGTALIRNTGPYSSPGTYGDPRGVGVSYKRGTPVQNASNRND